MHDPLGVFVVDQRKHDDELGGAVSRHGVALAQAQQDVLLEQVHRRNGGRILQDAAVAVQQGEQRDEDGLAGADQRPGLNPVKVLEDLVIAEIRAVPGAGFFQILLDDGEIHLHLIDAVRDLLVQLAQAAGNVHPQLAVEQIRHIVVMLQRLAVLPGADIGVGQNLVDRLLERHADDGRLAHRDDLFIVLIFLVKGTELQHAADIKGGKVRRAADHPVGITGIREEIAVIIGDGLFQKADFQLFCDAGSGSLFRKALHLFHIHHAGQVGIPQVRAVGIDDKRGLCVVKAFFQQGPCAVNQVFQRVQRVAARIVVIPKHLDQLFHRGFQVPVRNQVFDQKPNLLCPSAGLAQGVLSLLNCEFSQHGHVDGIAGIQCIHHAKAPFPRPCLRNKRRRIFEVKLCRTRKKDPFRIPRIFDAGRCNFSRNRLVP